MDNQLSPFTTATESDDSDWSFPPNWKKSGIEDGDAQAIELNRKLGLKAYHVRSASDKKAHELSSKAATMSILVKRMEGMGKDTDDFKVLDAEMIMLRRAYKSGTEESSVLEVAAEVAEIEADNAKDEFDARKKAIKLAQREGVQRQIVHTRKARDSDLKKNLENLEKKHGRGSLAGGLWNFLGMSGAAGLQLTFDTDTGISTVEMPIALNWGAAELRAAVMERCGYDGAIITITAATWTRDSQPELVTEPIEEISSIMDFPEEYFGDGPVFLSPIELTSGPGMIFHISAIRIYKRGPAAGVKVAAPLITPPDVAGPAREPVSTGPDVPDVLVAVDGTALGEMSIDELLVMDAQGAIQIAKEKLELSQKQGELLKKEAQNYKQKAEMFKAACETLEARKQD